MGGINTFRKLSSLEVCRQLQQLRNLAALQLGGFKRRLSWNFVSVDFINTLNFQASKLPSFRKSLTAFTMADRLSRVAERHPHFRLLTCGQDYTFGCRLAFTMAEILISLTIIGVIAAITLPALQANINESTWRTQRKALYSRMSQAIAMMPSLNGYGEFVAPDENGENGKDTVAMSFVTNGLGKVLELKNICDNQNLGKCGLPDKIKAVNGTTYSTKPDGTNPLTTLTQLNIKFHGSWDVGSYSYTFTGGNIDDFAAAGFETKNGESVIAFYNPYCVDYETAKVTYSDYINGFIVYSQRLMCANFVFDLNGKKGPNAVGKDIGVMSVLYPTDSEVVMPNMYKKSFSDMHFIDNNGVHVASNKCKSLGDYRLPKREELMSVFYNENLVISFDGIYRNFAANEMYNNEGFYVMRFNNGYYHAWDLGIACQLICVKR